MPSLVPAYSSRLQTIRQWTSKDHDTGARTTRKPHGNLLATYPKTPGVLSHQQHLSQAPQLTTNLRTQDYLTLAVVVSQISSWWSARAARKPLC
jgi:hypothetical protein